MKKHQTLNVFSAKDVERTREDENYTRNISLKDVIHYMQRDPMLSKSQILYQTLIKNWGNFTLMCQVKYEAV